MSDSVSSSGSHAASAGKPALPFPPALRRLVNFAGFYIGWYSCVAGAGEGRPLIGPAVVAGLLVLHLLLTSEPRRDARLILLVGLIGTFTDSFLAVIGVFSFTHGALVAWLCPLWLSSIWALFATTLNASMGWLLGRYVIASIFGALGGPLSYYYGARLGALALHRNVTFSLGCLVVAWGVTMPVLVRLAQRSAPQAARAH